MNPAIEHLFVGRNPVLREGMILAIRAHETINVVRLAALPELISPLVLLSTLAREWKEDDLVDDYTLLLDLAEEQFKMNPPASSFWHPENFLVSAITVNHPEIGSLPEAEYIANAYRELTGTFEEKKNDSSRRARKRTSQRQETAQATYGWTKR